MYQICEAGSATCTYAERKSAIAFHLSYSYAPLMPQIMRQIPEPHKLPVFRNFLLTHAEMNNNIDPSKLSNISDLRPIPKRLMKTSCDGVNYS